jgi:phosphoglycolate phosphatase
MPITSYRGVLFDLDGTGHPVEAYRYFVGDGTEILARRVLPPECRDERTTARCAAEFLAEYGRRWNNHTRPYPGIPGLLDGLAGRGIRMAILSNKKHELTELTVARLLPAWRFDAVAGARPDVPTKPDPTAAIRIAAGLRLPPREILYLGDTNTDMQTAVGAGMHPVGALWGFRTEEELRSSGARTVISRPQDLLAFFS